MGEDGGLVEICDGSVVCEYCEEPAVLRFQFQDAPLGSPVWRAGCMAHAGLAGTGAFEASRT